MPTRNDIELLVRSRNSVIGLAQRDIVKLFSALGKRDPAAVRQLLLDTVPALVRKHGNVAALAAADWYMQMRERDVPGAEAFTMVLGDEVPVEAVRSNVRYAARFLFGDDPAMTVRALQAAVGRHVKYAEMSTIWGMGERDPRQVRFALVPRPPMTCSWCLMLSSRGWVYRSEASGMAAQHSDCDCSVVPSWDAEKAHIDGYDPESAYRMYKAARKKAESDGSTADAAVAGKLRELFPDDLTDGTMGKRRFTEDGSIDLNVWRRNRRLRAGDAKRGHYGHEALARRIPPSRPDVVPSLWPDDLPELSAKSWNHILYGVDRRGGHLPGYEWVNGGTPFPVDWTKHDIVKAAEAVLRSPSEMDREGPSRVSYTGVVNGHRVRVALALNARGKSRIASIFCVDESRG